MVAITETMSLQMILLLGLAPKVWCYTNDPEIRRQNYSTPICPSLKAIDFSLDNDHKPDVNNSFTHAYLQKENLPASFTICTAFMVEAWVGKYASAPLFVLFDDQRKDWQWTSIRSSGSYTEFQFKFEGSAIFKGRRDLLFYPLQWTKVCLSLDSNTSSVRLVADSELLIETKLKMKNKPENLTVLLGMGWGLEQTGKTTNLNIFSSSLPLEKMKMHTSAGKKECGLEGDFLSWEKSVEEDLWILHSKARWVDLNHKLEGPCVAKAIMNIFPMSKLLFHSDCMNHCKTLRGRSPSVRSLMGWNNLWKELKYISPIASKLPDRIWLSTTEGDRSDNKGYKLGEPDHWPEGKKAEEGVWRDYYTGEQLENYTKPWMTSHEDKEHGGAYNCIIFYPKFGEARSWIEWQCGLPNTGCPCTYETPPLIHLRGFCSDTLLEHSRYTVGQSPSDPGNIILVGHRSAKIQYDSSLGNWEYIDPGVNVTARSRASPDSLALGKHNWRGDLLRMVP